MLRRQGRRRTTVLGALLDVVTAVVDVVVAVAVPVAVRCRVSSGPRGNNSARTRHLRRGRDDTREVKAQLFLRRSRRGAGREGGRHGAIFNKISRFLCFFYPLVRESYAQASKATGGNCKEREREGGEAACCCCSAKEGRFLFWKKEVASSPSLLPSVRPEAAEAGRKGRKETREEGRKAKAGVIRKAEGREEPAFLLRAAWMSGMEGP